jgi:uncharacterized membrane protein
MRPASEVERRRLNETFAALCRIRSVTGEEGAITAWLSDELRAIREVEALHAGEIRFAVETALDGARLWRNVPPRRCAIDAFSHLRVWDTAHNNGILIYVLLADRDVEIVADRAIAERVSQAEWEAVCRDMEKHFRAGDFGPGAVAGVRGVGRLLAQHFPRSSGDANELSDRPVLL